MNLVSVVIPCYNHAEFLEQSVLSVLASDYASLEIIIVDDGSQDDSIFIAQELSEQFPVIKVVQQNNQGPAAARNTGIRMAAGSFILPLDADDLISANYISRAIVELEDEQVSLVYCNAQFFGEKTGHWDLKPFSLNALAKDNMIFCSAVYRKRDWQAVGGYDERMTWGWEDWEFWISLLKNKGKVVKLPITGFYYRVHKNSRRKSTNKEAKVKTIELINNKHKEFIYQYLNGPLHYQRSWSKMINVSKQLFE
ncbi:MAG TPA: glycosyltransferase family A protein [Prolixibacteraceae bacterium]|jgi:glycosyltransferase involved in cell wall biosynthesis